MLQEYPQSTMVQRVSNDRECINTLKDICIHIVRDVIEIKFRDAERNLTTKIVNEHEILESNGNRKST